MSKGTFGFSSAKWPETAGKGADRSLARALQACLMSPAEATASRAVSLSLRNQDADSGVLTLRTATSPAHPGVLFSSLLFSFLMTAQTGQAQGSFLRLCPPCFLGQVFSLSWSYRVTRLARNPRDWPASASLGWNPDPDEGAGDGPRPSRLLPTILPTGLHTNPIITMCLPAVSTVSLQLAPLLFPTQGRTIGSPPCDKKPYNFLCGCLRWEQVFSHLPAEPPPATTPNESTTSVAPLPWRAGL